MILTPISKRLSPPINILICFTGWFIFVQGMMCIGLLFSMFSLTTLSITLMHYLIRYQVVILIIAFILESIASKCRSFQSASGFFVNVTKSLSFYFYFSSARSFLSLVSFSNNGFRPILAFISQFQSSGLGFLCMRWGIYPACSRVRFDDL